MYPESHTPKVSLGKMLQVRPFLNEVGVFSSSPPYLLSSVHRD